MKKFVLDGEMKRRIAMTVGGVLVSGFSVGMFQFSTMGMDPFQTFAHGLSSKITFLGYGSFYMILSLLFLAFDLIFMDRKKMGIATFINLFLLGYVVEFSSWLWNHIWPDPAIWLRIIMLALGVLIMCVGSSLYFVGDLGVSVYDAIAEAVLAAKDAKGNPVLTSFVVNRDEDGNADGTFTVEAGAFNCFDLSISIAISATAQGMKEDGGKVSTAYFNYGCGSVSVTPDNEGDVATVDFSISTGLYLENRRNYMYMGPENAAWASYYGAYLKETFVTSFSYDDYDPSYTSMQIDTALAGSNYLVAKTSEIFGDYAIAFAEDVEEAEEQSPIISDLQYFSRKSIEPEDGGIVSNLIEAGQRSYAYALALRQIMGNNLTIWRCVVTANLGDVMNTPDFQGVIEAAAESTLGVTNIGKAASLDAFGNLGGRHGMRFIADFSQYGRRNVAGRRMWLTMAALVTLTLNNNYKNGNEARPPMGVSYGKIQCDALSEDFTGPQRKMLAETFKLNPAIDENGFYLWEETTSQQADSALSDTHVIISYCWMKYMIYESMRPFVAEYNDTPTINEGVRVLKGLNRTFISRNYIEEGKPNADKNVLGDKVMRFDFPVRFKGVGRYVDVYVTAYPQTQSLEISLSEEA